MPPLSGTLKRELKSIAHHLKPVILIGKSGVTESLIAALDKSLKDHELIKIKFIDFKDEKGSLIEVMAARTRSEVVSFIGNTAVLFRQNADPERRKVLI